MGVSGCGKSSIGSALAKTLGIPFFDGDSYHSAKSIQKMQSGIPLTDDDRKSWLVRLNELVRQHEQLVIACSALKPEYRDILRNKSDELKFIYLKGDFDTIYARLESRQDHFFSGPAMLKSQFSTLVEPSAQEAIHIDIRKKPEQILEDILSKI